MSSGSSLNAFKVDCVDKRAARHAQRRLLWSGLVWDINLMKEIPV